MRAGASVIGGLLFCACSEGAIVPPIEPTPPRPPVASTTPSASATTSTSAAAPPAPPPDPIQTALASLGTLHGRFAVPGSSLGRPEATLAFSGDDRSSTGAWVLAPKPFGARPIHGWPSAVRVLGVKGHDRWAAVLVETVKWLDQPAGARGVVLVDVDGTRVFPPTEWWGEVFVSFVAHVREPADLAGLDMVAFAAARDGFGAGNLPNARALLREASTSIAAMRARLDERGLVLSRMRQGAFIAGERIDAGALEGSAAAKTAMALLAKAARHDGCLGVRCTVLDPANVAGVYLREVAGTPRIAMIVEPAPPAADAAATTRGSPKEVTATTKPDATARVLASRTAGFTAVAEAPLSSAGGTIGLGVSRTTTFNGTPLATWMSVVEEDGHAAVAFLERDVDGSSVRFADVDGDGRTDVVSWSARKSVVLLAPPPSAQARHLSLDPGTEWALEGAESADVALTRAMAVPTRGATSKDACRLLEHPSGLAAVSVPGARARYAGVLPPVRFDAPSLRDAPGATTIAQLDARAVAQLRRVCPKLSCSPHRPTCEGRFSARWKGQCVQTTARFWFDWKDGKLLLAGLAAAGSVPPMMPGPRPTVCE